jgi:hypothetical protein
MRGVVQHQRKTGRGGERCQLGHGRAPVQRAEDDAGAPRREQRDEQLDPDERQHPGPVARLQPGGAERRGQAVGFVRDLVEPPRPAGGMVVEGRVARRQRGAAGGEIGCFGHGIRPARQGRRPRSSMSNTSATTASRSAPGLRRP